MPRACGTSVCVRAGVGILGPNRFCLKAVWVVAIERERSPTTAVAPESTAYFTPGVVRGRMEYVYVVAAAAVAVTGSVLALAVLRKGRNAEAKQSRRAHADAQDRDPPVALGETYEFGVHEFTTHHSGASIAVGKVEGFVLFVEDVPEDVQVGDVVAATVLSWNDGRTSADATFDREV